MLKNIKSDDCHQGKTWYFRLNLNRNIPMKPFLAVSQQTSIRVSDISLTHHSTDCVWHENSTKVSTGKCFSLQISLKSLSFISIVRDGAVTTVFDRLIKSI